MSPERVEEFIYETAGVVGIDPRPFTFRELTLMRTGKEKEEWERLSFSLANQAAFQGAKKVKIESFNKFDMKSVQRVNNPQDVKRTMLG